jgi:hypothetical protein
MHHQSTALTDCSNMGSTIRVAVGETKNGQRQALALAKKGGRVPACRVVTQSLTAAETDIGKVQSAAQL